MPNDFYFFVYTVLKVKEKMGENETMDNYN